MTRNSSAGTKLRCFELGVSTIAIGPTNLPRASRGAHRSRSAARSKATGRRCQAVTISPRHDQGQWRSALIWAWRCEGMLGRFALGAWRKIRSASLCAATPKILTLPIGSESDISPKINRWMLDTQPQCPECTNAHGQGCSRDHPKTSPIMPSQSIDTLVDSEGSQHCECGAHCEYLSQRLELRFSSTVACRS